MPPGHAGPEEAPPGPADRQQVRLRVPAVRHPDRGQGGPRSYRVPRDVPRGDGRGEAAASGAGGRRRGRDPAGDRPALDGPDPGSPGDARAYHRATKHSRASVRNDRHALDWANKPFLFKVYPDPPAVPLPREVPPPALPALEAVARGTAPTGEGVVDTVALAQLLFFSAGLTKRKVYPGGETIHFRAAASTGALYQTEVYVVAGAVAGLEPGVYHFCPGDFTLRRLRAGDHRLALAEAAGRGDLVADAPATAILTAIHWRNTWKYRARAFRHFFWDAGTLLANLLATAVAIDVPARVLLGFADPLVNALLGIDATREGSLALVPLGRGRRARLAESARAAAGAPLGASLAARGRLSAGPRGLRGLEPRGRGGGPGLGRPRRGARRRARRSRRASRPGRSARRSSAGDRPESSGGTRSRAPGSRRSWTPPSARSRSISAGDALVETYLLVHAVDDLASGAYVWDPGTRALRLLKPGEFRREGGESLPRAAARSRRQRRRVLPLRPGPGPGALGEPRLSGRQPGRRAPRRAAVPWSVRVRARGHGADLLRRRGRAVLRAGRGGQGGDLRHGARTGRAPPAASGSPGGPGRPRAAPPGRGMRGGEAIP